MSKCDRFCVDKVFQRFKLIEFPTSIVGLSTTQILDVEEDLNRSAYLKTICEGRLLKFEEARQISANHRAYNVEQVDENKIQITFNPKNESITRAKRKHQVHNRFIFDLRLIKVDGAKCCNDEQHAEIGRFYICGQYDYFQITHQPKIIDFGDVVISSRVTALVRIKNESKLIAANVHYERLNNFEVKPVKFTLQPNSSKQLIISIRPGTLKVDTTLTFRIRNQHDQQEGLENDGNYITYVIHTKINISYAKKTKILNIESLHKLCDRLPKYTYLDKELEVYKERKALAMKYSEVPYANKIKKFKEQFTTGDLKCYTNTSLQQRKSPADFCKVEEPKASTYDLFNIEFLPNFIEFNKVAVSTYGKKKLIIRNGTKYNINIHLCHDAWVVYTESKLSSIILELKPMTQCKVMIFCHGYVEGNFEGSFTYEIDNKYRLKHMYSLQVSHPKLLVVDRSLKFGMVTTDAFIMSVPLRIYNEFNTPVNFSWPEIHSEIPFEVMPKSGTIPGQSCKICEVWYVCKPTKTKTHDIDFISECGETTVTPIELSIVTRKLSIKFLQPVVVFKEIPLNLETIETVKLENSSREMAIFQVIEPLIPGLRMEPMQGIIRPKMIMTLDIIVKIPCVLEFAFDVYVKINNKEVVTLSISGVVVEPRLNIQPKNIYMPRIPCNMISYVPLIFQNTNKLKTEVEVLDTGDGNIFDIYIANGQDKKRVFEFTIDGGQSKTVFIKVFDIFRREYEMYIPFKINGLLGPPIDNEPSSTELSYYIGHFEQLYENNPKVKLKSPNKDIGFCRIIGVITVPWITFSVEEFEFDYIPHTCNTKFFTITNISKYNLYVTISTLKLPPNFTLELKSAISNAVVNETLIAFDLLLEEQVELSVKFHPRYHGHFVATAIMFLDKPMTIPYSNLTFYGKRMTPKMTPCTYRVIFPPCYVGDVIKRIISVEFEEESDLGSFSCYSKDEKHIQFCFVGHEIKEINNEIHTIVSVELTVSSELPYTGYSMLNFNHESESGCDIEVYFCVTYCPLTLHAHSFTEPEHNPYPYYPLSTQTDLYEYLETCCAFLEKWMFLQGFRRDLCPVIPDTFHAISSALTSQSATKSSKGINMSYLNFVRRIAGPLMKHVRKVVVQEVDESFRSVKEIHDAYRGIITLLQSRSANLSILQPKFLLSYDQFVIYEEHVTPTSNADIVLSKKLLSDADSFHRLNKQSWIDFILQSYKVFVMDSCFFECVCVSNQPRDIVKILVDWFNEHIQLQHLTLRGKSVPLKLITNITTDLTDGIALAAVIVSYCPFLKQQFSIFCEITEETKEGDIVNNACLIVEAMNQLRLFFPLCSKDFFEPNFIQMLFLSIHLYIVLPMFKPKETIVLNPPLLRSSNRHVTICPSSQETLMFSHMILNNNRNAFVVEKIASPDNGKKMFISVRYIANFVNDEKCLLLLYGYNKTRIFDTYIVFELHGQISSLNPERKCRVTGPLYRPNKVDILVASPFPSSALFDIHITDVEPSTPVKFDDTNKARFFVRRLNLIDKDIYLNGLPKEAQPADTIDQKLYLYIICLSTQVGNSWIWFRSEVGHFFVRVTTQPRWDIAIDTLQSKVHSWPTDPCSCGESCECYRTTAVSLPHRNELMLKGLRAALVENASPTMMNIYDQLIESTTGKLILAMLFEEGGTNMSELHHILRSHTTYRIWSRALLPRIDRVTFHLHTDAVFTLPITVPNECVIDKYAITLTSDCGMDIRTYRINFVTSVEKFDA